MDPVCFAPSMSSPRNVIALTFSIHTDGAEVRARISHFHHYGVQYTNFTCLERAIHVLCIEKHQLQIRSLNI